MDPKDIKCPFQWWGKHEAMFPMFGFLAHQILNIVKSSIETILFFFSEQTYKPKEMLFIIKKFRKFDICEQKLTR
jgi:hypothetical protein